MKPWIILSLLLVGLCFDQLSADGDMSDDQETYDFKVYISGLSVEITCPKNGPTTLKKGDSESKLEQHGSHKLENYSSDKNGLYDCNGDYLYLHAYVCETCTEVTVTMMACVVIADCLITIGVCVTVYMFCKRKPGEVRENGFTKGARTKGNKERPPPVPNPDYEPIQKRRQDVYDGLNQNLK